jgi:hypothetical protein
MFWVGGRKQLQKIKINRWATVGKGLIECKRGEKSSFDVLPMVPGFNGYSYCEGCENEVNDD